jgi:hypothetical protein
MFILASKEANQYNIESIVQEICHITLMGESLIIPDD